MTRQKNGFDYNEYATTELMYAVIGACARCKVVFKEGSTATIMVTGAGIFHQTCWTEWCDALPEKPDRYIGPARAYCEQVPHRGSVDRYAEAFVTTPWFRAAIDKAYEEAQAAVESRIDDWIDGPDPVAESDNYMVTHMPPEQLRELLCPDYPAPCNCDNPVTHEGHNKGEQ